MRNLISLLFVGGLVFLLLVLTLQAPFAEGPMLVGKGILQQGTEETGTANLVTSVVLGYRGYDTLGELSILFTAALVLGVVLGRRRPEAPRDPDACQRRSAFPPAAGSGAVHHPPRSSHSRWRFSGRRDSCGSVFSAGAGTTLAAHQPCRPDGTGGVRGRCFHHHRTVGHEAWWTVSAAPPGQRPAGRPVIRRYAAPVVYRRWREGGRRTGGVAGASG